MAGAFESIASATVTSTTGATSVTFSSISSSYTDLQIRGILRVDGAYDYYACGLLINNDVGSSGNKYAWQRLITNNGTTTAAFESYTNPDRFYWPYAPSSNSNSLAFASFIININDYANADKKAAVQCWSGYADTSGTRGLSAYVCGIYNSTSAITRIDFTTIGGMTQIKQYSTFNLYGIKNS